MKERSELLTVRVRLAVATGILSGAVFAMILGVVTDLGTGRILGCAAIAAAMLATASVSCARWILAPLRFLAERALACSWDRSRPRLPVVDPEDELGQLADAFNNLSARLEESLEETRRFASDASHELRTPLTALRSMGEVALSKRPPDVAKLRDCVGAMLEETSRMSRLVEDLLMLSRGELAPPRELRPVRVAELLEETTALLRILAEEKKQTLETECEEGTTVLAEPEMLRLALVNLLQNAIRHSPPGSRVRAAARTSDLAVTLEVSDDGPGIAREHQARIFERFYRTDRGRSRSDGGSGLGLAIAKWAVARCDGEIGLRSSLGNGSTFFICLKRPS